MESYNIHSPPMFKNHPFNSWRIRFETFLECKSIELLNILRSKYVSPSKPKKKWNELEKKLFSSNELVLKLLHSTLDSNLSNKFAHCSSAFELMQCLEKMHKEKGLHENQSDPETCQKLKDNSFSCESSPYNSSCDSSDDDGDNDDVMDESNFTPSKYELLVLTKRMLDKLKVCKKRIKFLELENKKLSSENARLSSSCDSHLMDLKKLICEKDCLIASANNHKVHFKTLVVDYGKSMDLCDDLIARNKSLLLSQNILFEKIKNFKNSIHVENDSTPKFLHTHAHSHTSMCSMHHQDSKSYIHHSHRDISSRPIYVCDFCGRHGHLAHFCYDRLSSIRPKRYNVVYSHPTNHRGPNVMWVPKCSSNVLNVGAT